MMPKLFPLFPHSLSSPSLLPSFPSAIEWALIPATTTRAVVQWLSANFRAVGRRLKTESA